MIGSRQHQKLLTLQNELGKKQQILYRMAGLDTGRHICFCPKKNYHYKMNGPKKMNHRNCLYKMGWPWVTASLTAFFFMGDWTGAAGNGSCKQLLHLKAKPKKLLFNVVCKILMLFVFWLPVLFKYGTHKERYSIFSIFMKSPIGDILLFPLRMYWLFRFMGPGQGKVTAKQQGKGKKRKPIIL